jgi:hypothetical protein
VRQNNLKGVLISLAAIAVVVGAFYFLNESDEPRAVPHEPDPGGQTSSADAGVSPRERLLHASAEQIGITPVRGVWGVIMERGYKKGVATVVALADGTANLYISSGGSVVGGREYPPTRLAALKLCEQAADSLADTVVAHDFPAPTQGRVRFYVLTPDGVHATEGDIFPTGHDDGGAALGPLLAAGDAVLDGLKEATSRGLIR